jgi:tRNA (guanine-N(7)-)-methyltransferase subunit TRM82
MGRKRWNKKHPEKAQAQKLKANVHDVDPPTRLLALQPGSSVMAIAAGSRVVIVDTK